MLMRIGRINGTFCCHRDTKLWATEMATDFLSLGFLTFRLTRKAFSSIKDEVAMACSSRLRA
jgi:hypothetical protein